MLYLAYGVGALIYIVIGRIIGRSVLRIFCDNREEESISWKDRCLRYIYFPLLTRQWNPDPVTRASIVWNHCPGLVDDVYEGGEGKEGEDIAFYLSMYIFFWPILRLPSIITVSTLFALVGICFVLLILVNTVDSISQGISNLLLRLFSKKPQSFKEYHRVTLDKKIAEFDRIEEELESKLTSWHTLVREGTELTSSTSNESDVSKLSDPILSVLQQRISTAETQKEQLSIIRQRIEKDREALELNIKFTEYAQRVGDALENDDLQAQATSSAQTAEATVHALRSNFDEAFRLSANALTNIQEVPFESIEPVLADGVEKDQELHELLDHVGKELATE